MEHASDCAVHNGPAYPPGQCDCEGARAADLERLLRRYHEWHMKNDGYVDGYLSSGMYEEACKLMPELAELAACSSGQP